MDRINKLSAFINEDFAYFLGLCVGRGKILQDGATYKLLLEFPYKNLTTEAATESTSVHLTLSNSVDKIISRLHRIGLRPHKRNAADNKLVSIEIEWPAGDMTGSLLNYLLNDNYHNYHNFRVPRAIFEADNILKAEFLRGVFDITGYIRASNRDMSGFHRIYIEVDYKNWFLPLDLLRLFQMLDMPVQNINWGHPNMRDPNVRRSSSWNKEHQFKIYANQFLPIGSYIDHKQQALSQFAAENPPNIGSGSGRINIRLKPIHPDENSEKLPEILRGKHFDHYSELTAFLGQHDPESSWK